MNTELSNEEVINRLIELQGDESNASFARKLGINTGTWSKIVNGKYPVGLENIVETKLRGALRTLEDINSNTKKKPLLRLTYAKKILTAISAAFGEERRRLIFGLAKTGGGKTKIAEIIKDEYHSSAILLTVRHSWASYTTACLKIASALGVSGLPRNKSMLEEAVINALKDKNCVLVIDEAYHLGSQSLNIVKHILNECPKVVIVLLSVPKLWEALELKEYENSIQLKSRCCDRFLLTPSADQDGAVSDRKKDVETFLKAYIKSFSTWNESDKKYAINEITDISFQKYAFETIDFICSSAVALAAGKDVSRSILEEAINAA